MLDDQMSLFSAAPASPSASPESASDWTTPRGNLALVALGLAQQLRPEWLVFENVPGLLSSSGGDDFAAFLSVMGQCGYFGAWRVLDAKHFGVPQRRRRVFFVGHLGDWRRAAAAIFEPESLRRHPSSSSEARKATSDCAEPGATWWDGGDTAAALTTRGHDQEMPDKGNFAAVISPTVTSKWAKGSGGPAGAETGNLVQGAGLAVRRLSARECERLQGFPDDHTLILWRGKSAGDAPRLKAIGNSMAVPVVRWILSRLERAA